jgi:hypothetical protein
MESWAEALVSYTQQLCYLFNFYDEACKTQVDPLLIHVGEENSWWGNTKSSLSVSLFPHKDGR